MAQHLAIYAESANRSASLINMTAVADQSLSVSGDSVKVPTKTPLIAAAYVGDTAPTRAQLQAPSMGDNSELEISPLNLGATEPLSPGVFMDLRGHETKLVPGENLQIVERNGGNTQGVAGVFLTDGNYAIPAGVVETIHYTSTITCVAHTYVAGAITLTQQLKKGRYACIGFTAQGDTLIMGRLIFPGQSERPGVLGQDAVQDLQAKEFLNGGFGILGEFEHDAPPQLECFATTTDSAQTGILQVIKIA